MKDGTSAKHSENCCADVLGASTAGQAEHGHASSSVTIPPGSVQPPAQPTTAGAALQAFGAMMRSATTAGAIDEKSKELVLFALVVHSRCGPCFAHHYERAIEMGITQQQLDEAAWCAVAMGGAPVRMFYEEALESAKTRPSGP